MGSISVFIQSYLNIIKLKNNNLCNIKESVWYTTMYEAYKQSERVFLKEHKLHPLDINIERVKFDVEAKIESLLEGILDDDCVGVDEALREGILDDDCSECDAEARVETLRKGILDDDCVGVDEALLKGILDDDCSESNKIEDEVLVEDNLE